MKKKSLLILSLFMLIATPTFADIDYGINNGDRLRLFSSALVVRNDLPSNRNRTSAIATLPQGTEITIKMINKDWAYIEWYSKVNNKYKNAWASTTALCAGSGRCDINQVMRRCVGQIYEVDYINEATEIAYKDKNYQQAIEKSTSGLSAIFSITSLKNDSNKNAISNIEERIALGYLIRGYSYSSLGEYHQAIEDITESMKYKVLNIAYALRAINYEQLGYYSKAKADYLKAKQLALAEGNEKQVIDLNECIKRMDMLIQKAK